MSLEVASVKQFPLPIVSVEELLDLSIQKCMKAMDAHNFTGAGEYLKDCLALAGTDEDKIERVRKAIPSSLKLWLFGLILSEKVNFLYPLIDLNIPEINAEILDVASDEEKGDIMARVLEKSALPTALLNSYLDDALFNANVKQIRLLLLAGADPNEKYTGHRTFIERAISLGRSDIIAAFFACSRHKIDPVKAVRHIDSSAREIGLNELDLSVAKRIPPLCESVRIQTPHVRTDKREILKKRLIDPFLHPHSSIKQFIAPLAFFAAKETVEDPQFTVLIHPVRVPSRTGPDPVGQYSRLSGKIDLFVEEEQLMTDREMSEGTLEFVTDKDVPKLLPEDGTLVHEMAHKAYDKIGREKREKIERFKEAVLNSVPRVSQKAGAEIRKLLKPIPMYHPSAQFEECLVRTPQILYAMAKNHPEKSAEEIEQSVKKHIPELFKVYTEQFLPEIIAYNLT